MTRGAGGVSLLTAGEKHTDVGHDLQRVVVPDTVSITNISVSQWLSFTKCSKHSQGYQHTDPDSFAPEENSNDFHESLDRDNLKNVTDSPQLIVLGVLAYLRLAAEAALRSTGS